MLFLSLEECIYCEELLDEGDVGEGIAGAASQAMKVAQTAPSLSMTVLTVVTQRADAFKFVFANIDFTELTAFPPEAEPVGAIDAIAPFAILGVDGAGQFVGCGVHGCLDGRRLAVVFV